MSGRSPSPAPMPQPPVPVLPPGPREPGRIAWLFRDAARERRIHPLMRLIEDYRRGAGEAPPC
jgi:hypothetical protein